MSKIGRKSIDISGVNVEVKGKEIHFSGPLNKGVYRLDEVLKAEINDNSLSITLVEGAKKVARGRVLNRIWGMHRALLANEVIGAKVGFSKKIIINGLGYKAVMSGKKVVFTLGYSHKINFELPELATLEIDKSGKNLVVKSSSKELVGHIASKIRSFRPPEPYKGTGILVGDEVVLRKAGKTKSS